MIAELVTALGLVLVLEGLLYALVPGHLKKMLLAMADFGDDQLRLGGLAAITLGVVVVWLVRGVSG